MRLRLRIRTVDYMAGEHVTLSGGRFTPDGYQDTPGIGTSSMRGERSGVSAISGDFTLAVQVCVALFCACGVCQRVTRCVSPCQVDMHRITATQAVLGCCMLGGIGSDKDGWGIREMHAVLERMGAAARAWMHDGSTPCATLLLRPKGRDSTERARVARQWFGPARGRLLM